jgi:hypothetical protein
MYHSTRVESSQAISRSTYDPAYTKWGKRDDAERVEPSTLGYNIVMTLNHIYLFPRMVERFTMDKIPSIPTSNIDPSPPVLPASPSSDAPVIPSKPNPLPAQANPSSVQPVDRDEEPYLSLSLNSLRFAGMVLMKSEDELERVKTVGVSTTLAGVGRRSLNVILGGKEDRGHDDVFAGFA